MVCENYSRWGPGHVSPALSLYAANWKGEYWDQCWGWAERMATQNAPLHASPLPLIWHHGRGRQTCLMSDPQAPAASPMKKKKKMVWKTSYSSYYTCHNPGIVLSLTRRMIQSVYISNATNGKTVSCSNTFKTTCTLRFSRMCEFSRVREP